MASPRAIASGLGSGKTVYKHALLREAARLGRLAFVSGAVALIVWSLVAPARASEVLQPIGPAVAGRVTVAIDGLASTVAASGTVGDALRAAGVARGTADRVSSGTETPVVAGQRIQLDRGMPVTLVDGGQPLASRSPRGTVGDLLAAAGIVLGPMDVVDPAPDVALKPGAIVRVVRIAQRQDTVLETVGFGVRTQADSTLDRGRQVVVTPGTNGSVLKTYLITFTDGSETARALVDSTTVVAAVDEVVRVGTRVPPAPAGGDIEAIIRAAAAAQGADPDQLLRVAYCESRYNPSAVNSSSGAAGLFQFMPATWAANSVRAGFGGASVFDPVAAANVAAYMFHMGQAGQWSCK